LGSYPVHGVITGTWHIFPYRLALEKKVVKSSSRVELSLRSFKIGVLKWRKQSWTLLIERRDKLLEDSKTLMEEQKHLDSGTQIINRDPPDNYNQFLMKEVGL